MLASFQCFCILSPRTCEPEHQSTLLGIRCLSVSQPTVLIRRETLMSMGPGRIERAIAALLDGEADSAFTTEDLCERVYSGVNRVGASGKGHNRASWLQEPTKNDKRWRPRNHHSKQKRLKCCHCALLGPPGVAANFPKQEKAHSATPSTRFVRNGSGRLWAARRATNTSGTAAARLSCAPNWPRRAGPQARRPWRSLGGEMEAQRVGDTKRLEEIEAERKADWEAFERKLLSGHRDLWAMGYAKCN